MEFSNYLKIKKNIPSFVNLLAVSKGFKSDQIRNIYRLGQKDFGESKLQEGLEKQELLKDIEGINWHFIGRLQSNKLRKIVNNFQYIHSVDSFEKLEKISMISSEDNKYPFIMLQVKLGNDPSKGGFNPKELLDKWKEIKRFENLNITGLMTINPKGISSRENFELFKNCRYLADSLKLSECSMGMSSDWEEAIDAGATWLRLGSLIFGGRS